MDDDYTCPIYGLLINNCPIRVDRHIKEDEICPGKLQAECAKRLADDVRWSEYRDDYKDNYEDLWPEKDYDDDFDPDFDGADIFRFDY